ncbi:hypothetical protein [Lake Baikal phage Baikal-20-5m-C28]|nr:hypothetical protein [Lake Baikal phage Baikal-20-5m-C28]
MKKAFFINGGAGRVLCAIPALEHHILNIDPTAPIIAEAWMDLFLTSKIIRNNVYNLNHNGLFDILKDRELISPEPYRLNAYFNQKANLIQAFDILINQDVNATEIPKTKNLNVELGKADIAVAKNLLNEAKGHLQREKVIVFQPFGSGARIDGSYIIDTSGRSFEVDDIKKIVKELNKNYAIILMSDIKIPSSEPMNVMTPEGLNLLQWAALISEADYFLGCDSVGQHMANAVGKPSTVIIGATYPENITYPENKKFNIIDNGKEDRVYSPIRIAFDMIADRNNENLMKLSDKTTSSIIKSIESILGKNNFQQSQIPVSPPAQQQTSCCK